MSGQSHGFPEFQKTCEAVGAGMQLTPTFKPDTALTLDWERALPGGSVEIVYTL